MKNLLVVGALVAAGGLGAAWASGTFCGGSCSASREASRPSVTTVAMQPTTNAAISQAVASAAMAMPAQADSFEVDGVHSSVLFRVKHNNVSYFYGRFNEVSGSFNLDKTDPSKSSMDISVNADSVDSNNEGRNKHLKGPDFFSTKEFPALSFVAKKFEKSGDTTFNITGDLTMRGTTKSVSVAVEHTGDGEGRGGKKVSGFEGKVTIKRSDYGVSYMVGPGLADEVTLIVSLQGAK